MASNKKTVEALEKRLEVAKQEFSKEFKTRWDRRTPVRTGALRKANTVVIAESSFEFDNEMPYFGYVEHGTPVMSPVGMLKTTVREAQSIWNTAMRRAKALIRT